MTKMGRHGRRPTQYSGKRAIEVAGRNQSKHIGIDHDPCQACHDLGVAVDKAHQKTGKKLRSHRKLRLVRALSDAQSRPMPVWSRGSSD